LSPEILLFPYFVYGEFVAAAKELENKNPSANLNAHTSLNPTIKSIIENIRPRQRRADEKVASMESTDN
jgi:hypothetical protein